MSIAPVQIITTPVSPPGLPHAFLSKPPPPRNRKRFATTPTPTESTIEVQVQVRTTRNRSNSTITTWAARVQPGSPAPVSPEQKRSPRRGSNARRTPVSGSFFTFLDTPSASTHPVQVHTPTTARTPEFKDSDLLIHGYASVFVKLPVPPSPAPLPSRSTHNSPTKRTLPKRPALSQFRSLSSLRMRSRSPSSPTRPLIPGPGKVSNVEKQFSVGPPTLVIRPLPGDGSRPRAHKKNTSGPSTYDRAVSRNRERFEEVAGANVQREADLMTLMDGGRPEDNVQRAMRERAARRGAKSRDGQLVVEAPYKDENGMYHFDEECTWEFRPLISPQTPGSNSNASVSAASPRASRAAWVDMRDGERRGSAGSVISDESSTADPEELAAFGQVSQISAIPAPTKERRRRRKPAPLNIASAYTIPSHPAASALKRVEQPPQSARADFLASSFAPSPHHVLPSPGPLAPPLSATSSISPSATEFGIVTHTAHASTAHRFTLASKTNVAATVAEEEPPMATKAKMSGVKNFFKSVRARR